MDSYSIAQKHGIKVRNRKLKERRLIVKFHINSKDTTEYYDAIKKLKRHLYKEEPLRIFLPMSRIYTMKVISQQLMILIQIMSRLLEVLKLFVPYLISITLIQNRQYYKMEKLIWTVTFL